MHKVPTGIARSVIALGVVAGLGGMSALAQNARPVLLEDLDKPAGPVTIGDPKVMPNIVGIALHMGVDEAMAVLRRAYPNRRVQTDMMPMPTVSKPAPYSMFLPQSEALNFADVVAVDLTLPPEKQAVWRVARYAMKQHLNRTTVLASLREKYGKETVAFSQVNVATSATTDDRQIMTMYWLFDEMGRPAPAPRALSDLLECPFGSFQPTTPDFLLWETMPGNQPRVTNAWATSSCIGVAVSFYYEPEPQPIIENIQIEAINIPLAVRTAKATTIWWKAAEERLRREEIEKTKTAKPRL